MSNIFKTIFDVMSGRGASLRVVATEEPSSPVISQGSDFSAAYPYGTGFGHYGSSSGGDGSKWAHGLSSSGSTPVLDHTMLRRNARSAYHQSLEGRAYVDRMADNVAGVGLRLKPSPDHEMLGITLDTAAEWSTKVEGLFDAWARSKKAHRARQMTFYQMQRLVMISQPRDGEYYANLTYRDNPDLLNPLQIGFWDPGQIVGYPLTDTAGSQYSTSGIEHDDDGREIAYRVFTRTSDGKFKVVRVDAFGKDSGRPLVLHGFAPEYAGQKNGYPRISHMIQELENITDLSSASIKKAINEAALVWYVKPSQDAPATNPLAGATSGPRGPAQAPVAPTSSPTDDGSGVRYNELNEVNLRAGSLGVFNLSAGEDMKNLEGKAASEGYAPFMNQFINSLAASGSMPPEVLQLKFSQNYSASRAALMLFWYVVRIWRQELESDFCDPVYEAWMAGEIAAGRISAPGWSDPRLRSAWLKSNWIGFPMPNIDPMRTAKADEIYAWKLGAKDLDAIAREQNGSSGAMNRARLKRQAAEMPVPPWDRKPESGFDDPDNPGD
ncbi:MAG: phage portal protein [Deltaproteobacteria bacterium]|nr:phage portal protein [Deltaproteobacteria bacterium]